MFMWKVTSIFYLLHYPTFNLNSCKKYTLVLHKRNSSRQQQFRKLITILSYNLHHFDRFYELCAHQLYIWRLNNEHTIHCTLVQYVIEILYLYYIHYIYRHMPTFLLFADIPTHQGQWRIFLKEMRTRIKLEKYQILDIFFYLMNSQIHKCHYFTTIIQLFIVKLLSVLNWMEFKSWFPHCEVNFRWCSEGGNQEGDAEPHYTTQVWKPYFKSSTNYFQIGNLV